MPYKWIVFLLLLHIPVSAVTLEWTWTAPTTNTDGTPLTDLASYRLYQGTQSGTHGQIAEMPPDATTYQQDIEPIDHLQTLYNVITAVDTSGNESAPSNEMVAQILPKAPQQWDTVDIRAYGAIPNDGQNDTLAIRNAAEALNNAGGGTLYLPVGVWDVFDIPLTTEPAADRAAPPLTMPLKHISMIGAGHDQTILKRIPYRTPSIDQRRLMTVNGAENFTLADLSIDINGVNRYGGAAFHSTTNTTIMRTRVYDSNPQPYDKVYDLYAYVFGFGGPAHRNLVFIDNVIDSLGVEIDHIDGGWVSGNTLTGCRSTTCLGTFSLQSEMVARNLHYVGNTIANPIKAGILLGWDRVVSHTRLESVRVLNNTIRYTVGPTTNAIRWGVGDNSQSTTGNIVSDMQVAGNQIVIADEVPVGQATLIFGNNSATANILFENMQVRHNRLSSTAERKFLDVRAGPQASTVAVYDNAWLVPKGVPLPSVALPIVTVLASADDGNVPANTLDGNLETRWSAQGKGQWILYDLGESRMVDAVEIAWYQGEKRRSTFTAEVSIDGGPWIATHQGQSSGQTLALETYSWPPVEARYLRITGQGNTQNTWNSITEVVIWGQE